VGVIYLVEFYLLACMPISNTQNSLVLLAYSSISLLGKSDEEQMMGYAIFDNDRWVL